MHTYCIISVCKGSHNAVINQHSREPHRFFSALVLSNAFCFFPEISQFGVSLDSPPKNLNSVLEMNNVSKNVFDCSDLSWKEKSKTGPFVISRDILQQAIPQSTLIFPYKLKSQFL